MNIAAYRPAALRRGVKRIIAIFLLPRAPAAHPQQYSLAANRPESSYFSKRVSFFPAMRRRILRYAR